LTNAAKVPYWWLPKNDHERRHAMLYDTDSADLIDFARRWAGLGDAVADQVVQVLDDARAAAGLREDRADLEVNPNAIVLARERLGGLNEEIDQAFEEYFALRAGEVA
jgi:hypothetical protein